MTTNGPEDNNEFDIFEAMEHAAVENQQSRTSPAAAPSR